MIMAGGREKRLQPLAHSPKPLRCKRKIVLIHIMDLFKSNGLKIFLFQ